MNNCLLIRLMNPDVAKVLLLTQVSEYSYLGRYPAYDNNFDEKHDKAYEEELYVQFPGSKHKGFISLYEALHSI